MKLLDWMKREAIDDEVFARLVNKGLPLADRITSHAVKKWKYGEKTPPADKLVRIQAVTGDEVCTQDFVAETVKL